MANICEYAYFGSGVVRAKEARLSVASAAILYGLSVYTVFPVCMTSKGPAAFRLKDHFKRLVDSTRIIGIDRFVDEWTESSFTQAIRDLVAKNNITTTTFFRATVHVSEELSGMRARGMGITVSIFAYEAIPLLPETGARLKVSTWRRTPDYAIPSRAKVNGAYVNSVLAKQEALDHGYDDCIFLDTNGHVCELSAANLFLVRNGRLLTPSCSNDLLEGITHRTVFEIAKDMDIPMEERVIDMTELYIVDEAFACGTSALVAPVTDIDGRTMPVGPITARIRERYAALFRGEDPAYERFFTFF